jgi:UDP-N-acetylglucosamine 1-carboxyvinyltransferase
MQNRFQYVEALQQMGASIELFNPTVENPDQTYNFNLEDDSHDAFHAIKITGPSKLHAGRFRVHDLRHGATLILAALAAEGTSIIGATDHVDRGYEALAERLTSMGADIQRVDVEEI